MDMVKYIFICFYFFDGGQYLQIAIFLMKCQLLMLQMLICEDLDKLAFH